MDNEIISYIEMCRREGTSLQQGMNFARGAGYSIILMSRRKDAPYHDELQEGGTVLIYEGHDTPKTASTPNPKLIDQPERTKSGRLTQNGLFHRAAQETRKRNRPPERVRVYEKIQRGIWAYNGLFHLVDSWKETSGSRKVFKFKLVAVEGDPTSAARPRWEPTRRRVIPTAVKLAVWKRDRGRCVICGASDELHFDHIVPYSKGGTSLVPENIQLLCARHNLEKRDQIR